MLKSASDYKKSANTRNASQVCQLFTFLHFPAKKLSVFKVNRKHQMSNRRVYTHKYYCNNISINTRHSRTVLKINVTIVGLCM